MFLISNIKNAALLGLRVLTYLLYAATFLSAYAMWIDPRHWALPSILALGFLPLFLLTVVCTIIWALVHRHITAYAGVITTVLSLYNFFIVSPISLPSAQPKDSRLFKVMSFNSYYCIDTEIEHPARNRALDYLADCGADVICMQEIYDLDQAAINERVAPGQIDTLRARYPYRLEAGRIDVATFSRYPIKPISVAAFDSLQYFQYQALQVDFQGTPITLLNVHLSSYDLTAQEREIVADLGQGINGVKHSAKEMRRSIYGKLADAFAIRARAAEIIRDFAVTIQGDLILCGDFNDVPGSFAYHTIRDANLLDAYTKVGLGPTYTYRAHKMYFHIDQILYRGDLTPVSFERCPLTSSDHYPVMATFALPSPASSAR